MFNNLISIYFIFNLFIFVFSIYIAIKTTPDLARKAEYTVFKTLIISFCIYLFTTNLWTLQEYELIHMPRIIYIIVCFIVYLFISYTTFCFYTIFIMRFEMQLSNNLFIKIFSCVPFGAQVILLIISFFNGIIFSVDENSRMTEGPLYILLLLCSGLYLVAILVISIIFLFKGRTRRQRKQCAVFIGTTIVLVGWIILDAILANVTILPIAVFAVILCLFINVLQSNVYIDALTGLGNRRKCEEFLSNQIMFMTNEEKYVIYMTDLNSFKSINDTFGHSVGDDALITFAKVIKKRSNEYGAFCARFGGDEFVVALKTDDEKYNPNIIMNQIQNDLTETCIKENKLYKLTTSYGYSYCDNNNKDLSYHMNVADKMLYKNKEHYHHENS